MDRVQENIERWKATAEIFLVQDIKAFIQDTSGNIYFCNILLVGEHTLLVDCFGPKQRAGKKETLYWPLITKFEALKEQEE